MNYSPLSNSYKVWVKIISIVIIVSSLVSACRSSKQATEQESPQTGEGEVQLTPEVSPTPRADLPPALVEVSPVPGSVIGVEQVISLFFNQPMQKNSVEGAIRFEPKISGRFAWQNDHVLTFTPDQQMAAGSKLRLELDTSARAANNKQLQDTLVLDYEVSPPLEVLQVVPSDNAKDVDPESVVFVTFNQPVVALGGETSAPPAFSIEPEVPGEGQWLNTATYSFIPEPSMLGGTQYTIQLNQNLKGTMGAGFDSESEDHFRFTTTTPSLVKVLPDAQEKLSLDGPIELSFNVRMDPDSVEEHFSLVGPDGNPVQGEFEWDEGSKIFQFTPKSVLERNTTYRMQLDQETASMGGITLDIGLSTSRRTYPQLALDANLLSEFEGYSSGYGSYEINFTVPIDSETYRDYIRIEPESSNLYTYLRNQHTLVLSGYFEPETTYNVSILAGLTDTWGGMLDEDISTLFFTPPAASTLTINTGYSGYNLLFTPTTSSEITVQATNITRLYIDISPISVEEFITLIHPDNYEIRRDYFPESMDFLTFELNLTRNANEVIQLPLTYQGNSLKPGVYFLGISSPDVTEFEYQSYQKYYLFVSDNNIVMKNAPGQVLVWATKLEDFSPVNDVPVSVYTTKGEKLAEGQTGADGIFFSDAVRPEGYYNEYFAILGEPGQSNFCFAISSWNQSTALYESGITIDSNPPQLDAYLYTDRPIYRPGDQVYFRIAVFARENGTPIPSGLDKIDVAAYGDPGISGIPLSLFDDELDINQFGTVEGQFTLPEDAPPGLYYIEVRHNDRIIRDLYFDVAAYRKPEVELSLELSESEVLAGQDLTAEMQADTYFGLPVSDQSYSWTLFRKETFFYLSGYKVGPDSLFWLMPPIPGQTAYGPPVSSGEGETDGVGHASLDITSEDFALDETTVGSTQRFTFSATVTTPSGFPVSARESVLVHPEEFYIGVKTESYVGNAESPFAFSILTVDWDQQPVGKIPIEARFETIEWVPQENSDLYMPIVYIPVTSPVASASPVTGEDGQARVTFTPPDPGTYQLTLESGDALTQLIVWVAGKGSAAWPRLTDKQIKITADAENYQPGQIAQVFFPNPFPDGAKALISIERGEIMETQIIDVTDAALTVPLPISDEAIPNIYISVTLLGRDDQGRLDYRHGILELPVAPISKNLNIEVSLDPTKTEPGQTVSASLRVTDQQGEPVQGEFSVAVIDKAVLALVERNTPSVLDAFYGLRHLSVLTSFSLKTFSIQNDLISMGAGLGGGGDGMEALTIREEFPDTAFWRGEILTGSDGTAQLEIPLPDSLTTWVVVVWGLTEDFLVGETEAEILTQKELMIQPVTPRFLVDGDIVELAAVVYNNTQDALSVDVSLQTIGFSLNNNSEQNKAVDLGAGENARVSWYGQVESVETVDLVFRAVAGDRQDASAPLWGDLEVKRYTMPYTMGAAGQLTQAGQRLELISLPQTIDLSSGNLTLVLNPSLTSTLVEGLEAMEQTPYHDTISILSRMLANLNSYLTLKDLGIESPQLQNNLHNLAEEGVKQVLDLQNFDGGWSWWYSPNIEYQSSDPFISSYVLLGLEQASDAGLQVGEAFVERALEYLSRNLMQPDTRTSSWMLDRLAFQVFALRNSDLRLNLVTNVLYARRSEMNPWAVGLLALTINHLEGQNNQVATLLNDLEAWAVRSQTGIYWESSNLSWMLPGTPNFTSAVVIYTLAQLDPASQSLGPALQYMLTNRKLEQLGSSNFETAWMLMAITAAMRGTGDYQADYDFQAYLNDVLILEGSPSGPAPLTAVKTSEEIASLYPDLPNALLIERGAGEGVLYYRVDLQTFQHASEAEPINKGISLSRGYYLADAGCVGGEDCDSIDGVTLDPDGTPQIITVALTMIAPHDMVNLMVEDFIPAGTEIVNQKFLTTQILPEVPLYDPLNPFDNGWGWWYFDDPQIYDDRIMWTVDYLPAGTYILTYQLLPFQRGEFQVLPAHAWQYFYPEVQGTTAGDQFTID